MKKLLYIFVGFLIATPVFAQVRTLIPSQGGTGIGSATAGDIGTCLKVSNNSPFTYELGTCGTGGSGSPGGSNTQVQFNDAGGFGGDAGFIYDKTNDLATIVHLLLTGSSTLQAFTFTNATGSKATTTSFAITSILSKLLKTDGNGSVIGAVAGTDYENPLTFSTGLTRTVDTVTVNTSQNISTLSNLTSNGFVKTSGGTGALSIDTTTYTPTTRTLTVAGTANQITSSAGAQNLSANRTWTLSLPSHVIFPGNFQVTNSTTTNATTTALDVTGTLTFNGVTGSAWSDFCTTITGSASLCDGNDATGSGGSAVATSSSETSGRIPFWTSTNATPATLSGGVAGFAFDSTLTKLTVTNASTTNLSVGSLSGILKQSSGVVSAAANGTDYTLITGTTCSGNDKVSAISASGSVTCSTDQTSAGGSAAIATSTNETAGRLAYWTTTSGTPAKLGDVSTSTLSAGTGINTSATLGSLVGGSNAVLSIDQSFSPTWTGAHIFNNITRSTTTQATTTNLAITSIASKLLKVNASGSVLGAVSNTDYQAPITLTTTGTSGAATFDGTTLNIPNYATGGGGSGGGTWSTTTSNVSGQLINYSNNNTDIVVVGSSSTTTAPFFVDPNLNGGTASTTRYLAGKGSFSKPSYSFSGDEDTGFYSDSADSIRIVAGSINPLSTGPTGTFFFRDVLGNSGIGNFYLNVGQNDSATDPTYTFIGDTNTGLYSDTEDTIGLTANGRSIYYANTASTTIPIGNFAVGTTSPSYSKLSVSLNTDTYNPLALLVSSSTPTATTTIFQVDSNGRASTTNLTISGLGNGSTQCLHIDGSGNLTGTGSDCGSGGGGLTSYDAWTHPSAGVSATTSQMIFTNASSTFTGNLNISGNSTTTNATTSALAISSIASKLLRVDGNGSVLGATNGTDYTLITAQSCTNQVITAITAAGISTCSSVSNAMLANSTVSYGGVTLSLGGSDATPAFDLTDATNLPISTGVSGLAAGIATFLGTPSSANLASAVTNETGSGLLVFATSPTLTTPNLGTPSAVTLTNGTGLPISGLTGLGTGVGTFLGTPSSANLASALTDETGTGSNVFSASPTFTGTVNGASLLFTASSTFVGGLTIGTATTTSATSTAFHTTKLSVGNTGQYVTATTTGTLSIASTTLGIDSSTFAAGTTTQSLHFPEGRKLTSIGCQVSAGTSLTVEIGTGSASSTAVCTTTFSRIYPSANNTFTADQRIYVGVGSKSGTPDRIEITPTWFKTAP